jgi:hypothetical protein
MIDPKQEMLLPPSARGRCRVSGGGSHTSTSGNVHSFLHRSRLLFTVKELSSFGEMLITRFKIQVTKKTSPNEPQSGEKKYLSYNPAFGFPSILTALKNGWGPYRH